MSIHRGPARGRRVARVLTVLCASGLLAAFIAPGANASVPAASGSYNIGTFADLTGGLAANGISGIAGIQDAVKQAGGKVNGHAINLATPIDTLSTGPGGTSAAVQLVSSN